MTSSSQYTPNRLATIVFITKSFEYSRRRGALSSSMSFVVALPFVDAFVVVDSDSSAVVSHRVFFRIASVEPSSSPPSPLGPFVVRPFRTAEQAQLDQRQRSILPPRLVRMLQYHDATIAH
jgi:hypothetical protein